MLSVTLLLTALLAADPAAPAAKAEVRLWEGKAPESVGDEDKNTPTVTIYRTAEGKGNGTACVVCPGGGYGALANDHEGKQIAEWLNQRGVTAFVLKYRIAGGKSRPTPLQPAPMLDVQRAIRFARSKAKEFGLDEKRIGVWGFSAGGHLASTAATHFDAGKPDATDPIDKLSCRPDFAILSYPVISMEIGVTHGGSRNNLIGAKPDDKLVTFYSNDKQVTKDTPPTFLFHTADDKAVPLENSLRFKAACEKNGVPVELVVVDKGPHGVGLANNPKFAPELSKWPEKLESWMKGRGLLGAK